MSGFSKGTTGLIVQAVTPAAGFAKQNGNPTIISWTTPNDGNLHSFIVCGSEVVTALETGGAVGVNYTIGGHPNQVGLFAAGSGAGTIPLSGIATLTADPNTTVSVLQTSALTAGGPTLVYVSIIGR